MGIFNIFSKRQKQLRGEVPEVYQYDDIPHPLRVQIVHIWEESLGNNSHNRNVEILYSQIVKVLCKEYDVFGLSKDSQNKMEELITFFLKEKDTEKVLDVIELSFFNIDRVVRDYNYIYSLNSKEIADDAIEELNTRFKEHGVGYQFEGGKIIRTDSQFLHSETVKPALTLLNEKEYAGAQQEFLNAHEHYRHGKYKEALNDALKSLESTMKAICDKHNWSYDPNDTSKN